MRAGRDEPDGTGLHDPSSVHADLKPAGAPLSSTPSVAVTWFSAQMLSPVRPVQAGTSGWRC